MTQTKTSAATSDLVKSVQETNKLIVERVVATQEYNLTFAQSVLENSVEVLKSHAESTRTLMEEVFEHPTEQRVGLESLQAVVDSAIQAQERNARLAQTILEDGIEVLKKQVDDTRSLMQDLRPQFQKQQEAFQVFARESMDAYRDFFFAPLTFWQKVLSSAETASQEGLKNFQKAAEQGLETFEKTARQAVSSTEKAARPTQAAASKTAG